MKAKEIRALARENLKQIPKKIYMSMGLLLVVANIIPSVVNQVTDSKSGVGVNIIFFLLEIAAVFLLEIAAVLLTANGYIFFDRWRNKIQKGGEEPNAWCGLSGAAPGPAGGLRGYRSLNYRFRDAGDCRGDRWVSDFASTGSGKHHSSDLAGRFAGLD